jgi:peptidoglycan-N-acetylglucosamine deacetylase
MNARPASTARGRSVGSARAGRVGFHLAALALAAAAVLHLSGLRLVPAWVLGLSAFALAWVLFLGLYLPAFGLFGRQLRRVRGARGCLALTFDDGPDPRATPRVLEMLRRRGHRATFFAIGARALDAPEIVRSISACGCTVGNHGFSHSWLSPFFGPRRLGRELARTQEAVVQAAGEAARPRFARPPVGLLGPWFEPAALALGLEPCAFSARAGDAALWTRSRRSILARVRRAIAPGAIIVLHDGAELRGRAPRGPELLEEVLDEVERAGLRSVTLEELCDACGERCAVDSHGGHAQDLRERT